MAEFATEQNPLTPLIDQLKRLPGIGGKSAQRLAFHLMTLPLKDINRIATVLTKTRENLRYCQRCFNISFSDTCYICSDTNREKEKLCIVADSKDIMAMERARIFKGLYHVLGGLISPMDGFHPELLRIAELQDRIKKESIQEIVLAINTSIEGDATVLYLTSVLKSIPVVLSRLAYGLPMGADLEYTDEMTLQRAFVGRTRLS